MIVVNTSPIITFGKQGKLDLLKQCFGKIKIPESVYREVMEKKDSVESIVLERAISENWIEVENVEINKSLNTKNLGKGEKEAITSALKNKCVVLIDDDSAKQYASILDVEAHGSLYVLYAAYMKNIIKKEEAKRIFEAMIRDGFYVSTDVYAKFLELLGGK